MTDKTDTKVIGAKELWDSLGSDHNAPLERARECAKLTIPALMPPQGSSDQTTFDPPYQSLGARGVNNLTSKLLLALFPPGSSPFRYSLSKATLAGAGQAQSDTSEVEKALAQRENDIMELVEASPQRPILNEYLMHLVVCGNAMLFYPDMQKMRMYRLDQYRIRRDGSGAPLDAAVQEKVHPNTLEDGVKTACEVDEKSAKEVEVYTLISWRKGKCEYWQEINGKEVPGSRGSAPAEASPWIPGRWKAVPGNHYGRGHVEELLGDLISYEGLSQAIVQFAAVASKIVFLKHPSATTRMEDINNAESGECVTGDKKDIDVLQLEKYADFQVAQRVLENLEQRLSQAFLLRSGATRDAERVTAEEIRAIAQELEDVVGGVYTVQSQELQLPWVNRTILVLEKAREIAVLPKGTVKPIIVTGFQALGRNHALNKVRGFVQDLSAMLTPQVAVSLLKGPAIAKRLGVGWGVGELDELLKTEEEIAAEQQQAQKAAMTQSVIDKAAGPMAQGIAKGDVELPPEAQAAMSGM
jgi:hypothetical protein